MSICMNPFVECFTSPSEPRSILNTGATSVSMTSEEPYEFAVYIKKINPKDGIITIKTLSVKNPESMNNDNIRQQRMLAILFTDNEKPLYIKINESYKSITGKYSLELEYNKAPQNLGSIEVQIAVNEDYSRLTSVYNHFCKYPYDS